MTNLVAKMTHIVSGRNRGTLNSTQLLTHSYHLSEVNRLHRVLACLLGLMRGTFTRVGRLRSHTAGETTKWTKKIANLLKLFQSLY